MASTGASGDKAGSSSQQNFFQLYRRSSVGMALTDALDELIESGHVSPQLARKVVEEVRSDVFQCQRHQKFERRGIVLLLSLFAVRQSSVFHPLHRSQVEMLSKGETSDIQAMR